MSWTDERIDRLKAMWAEGSTASQIAEHLGGVSRNAVIGKAHRLGLESRPSPVRAGEEKEKKVKAAPAATSAAKTAAPKPAPAPAAKAQPAPTGPAAERPAPEKPPGAEKAQFRYPNPLNLVPGKEFEAAGQILAVNGIPPQHPQYAAGLKAVEQVLVQFARANPSGGRLPTAQLERILRQLR